ncbi:MAG: hypothetical protein PUK59_01475 [Actinomycetaceae bacterium]|nr:hypothetical protein [Actinomycetaceae bacterium]MDY5854058.1 hypothetical protein [Arcanobacterium sp.]
MSIDPNSFTPDGSFTPNGSPTSNTAPNSNTRTNTSDTRTNTNLAQNPVQGSPQPGYAQYDPAAQSYPPQGYQQGYAQGYANPGAPAYAAPIPPNPAAPHAGGYGQFGEANAQTHHFQHGYGTVIPLRPLGIGDTLDAAFRLLKFNPVAYFVFPLIMGLIVGLFSAIFELLSGETSVLTPMGSALDSAKAIAGSGTIATIVLSFIVQIFVTIVGTRVTIASVRGQKVSLKESFALMKKRAGSTFARVLGFDAIVGAVFAVVFVIFMIVAFAAAGPAVFFADSATVSSDDFPVAALGVLLLILAIFLLLYLGMMMFYLRFALAPSAIVAENIGPIRAIRRSWQLTKGSFGYLLGTVIVVTLISSVIGSVVGGFFGIIAVVVELASSSAATSAVVFVSSLGMSVAFSMALAPVECVLMNLIYVNMRFRRENFHLRLIQETNGQA